MTRTHSSPGVSRAQQSDRRRAAWSTPVDRADGVWAEPMRTRRQLALDWILAFGISIILWSLIALAGWAVLTTVKAIAS